MNNKILIHETDKMFIPYGMYDGMKYILSILWNDYDPYDKSKSIEKWNKSDNVSVAVEISNGGKIVLFNK
jgi:hypothetical protein